MRISPSNEEKKKPLFEKVWCSRLNRPHGRQNTFHFSTETTRMPENNLKNYKGRKKLYFVMYVVDYWFEDKVVDKMRRV